MSERGAATAFVFLTPCPAPAGGGSRFNAGLIPALRALGHPVAARHDAEDVPPGIVVVDGLLLQGLVEQEGWAGQAEALVARGAVAVVHHVPAEAEPGIMPRLRRVVATSEVVAARLAECGVTASVLAPGHAVLSRSGGSGGPGCHILSVGVLTRRKGADRLLRALSRLTDLDWTLTLAGDAQRDAVHAASVVALVEELGLGGRVRVLPDPDLAALEPEWAGADLFAQASSWEGYPAGVAEALRRGIPVVATAVGGVPGLVPTSAGVLAPADEGATLSKCLRRAIFDGGLRAALAEGAWEAGLALPSWEAQARAFVTLIED